MSTQEEMKAALRKHLAAGEDSWFGNKLDAAVEFILSRSSSSEEVERRADRGTTHAVGCETWGPKHYECALATIERLKGEVERLHSLAKANNTLARMNSTRAEAAEARNTRLQALVGEKDAELARSAQGWTNAIELGLLPPRHTKSAEILRDGARAALQKSEAGE